MILLSLARHPPSLAARRDWHLASFVTAAGCRGFRGPVPSASLDVERGVARSSANTIHGEMPISQTDPWRRRPRGAGPRPRLTDGASPRRSRTRPGCSWSGGAEVLAANERRHDAASGRLDAGMLDRLRLDGVRIGGPRAPASGHRGSDPLEREIGSRALANGLVVCERRIPIGVIGANFEARPNVTSTSPAQLLKSLNAGVCAPAGPRCARSPCSSRGRCARARRSRAAADAVGLVRSCRPRGRRCSSRCPRCPARDPAGQRRPPRARADAARNGVRTLAHAEGGGVLYIHGCRPRARSAGLAGAASTGSASATGSTSRSSTATADPAPRAATRPVRRARPGSWRRARRRRSTAARVRVGERARSASRPSPSPWSTDSTRRCGSPTRRRPASQPGSSPRTAEPRSASSTPTAGPAPSGTPRPAYRRLRADRRARDGDQRRPGARAARPGHLPRPLAPPVPHRRRRNPGIGDRCRHQARAEPRGRPGGQVRRGLLRARGREIAALVKAGEPVCVVSSGAIALGLPRLGLKRRMPRGRRSRPSRGRPSAIAPDETTHTGSPRRTIRRSRARAPGRASAGHARPARRRASTRA